MKYRNFRICQTIILLLIFFTVNGQKSYLNKFLISESSCNLDFKTSQIICKTTSSSSLDSDNRFVIKNIKMISDDLSFDVYLDPEEKMNEIFTLELTPSIGLSNNDNILPLQSLLQQNKIPKFKKNKTAHTVIWNNFLNDYKYPDPSFILAVKAELTGELPVSCIESPDFSLKNQLPHYLIGAGSIISFMGGKLLQSSSDNIYEQYINEVFAENRDSFDTYTKANERRKAGRFMEYGSYAVFTVNAIVFGIRYFSYKKKIKEFEFYCEKEQKYKSSNSLSLSLGNSATLLYQF